MAPGGGAIEAVADAVRTGRTTAVEVVGAAIERIGRLDPALNAVVALRAEAALEEAGRVDRERAAGRRLGPLAGLPLLVKDLQDVASMPTTKGSLLFADAPPARADDLVTLRLRAAGAVVVGKTNLPEFAIEGYSANLLFGATGNPWAPGLSPGGSSGGSAAALAAGMVPIATATDGGGSVRIPAALCGLVGIKPTRGLIGRRPIPDWIDLTTDGPIATTVADLRLLLEIEQGPVTGDPEAVPVTPVAGHAPARLLAAHRTSDFGPLPGAVASAFDSAVEAMADVLSLPVQWMEPADFFGGGDPDLDWFVMAGADHVGSLGRDRVTGDLDRMHPASQAFFRDALQVDIDEYLAVRRRRFAYAQRLDDLLADGALLLTPTVAAEGWPADGRLDADGPVAPLPPSVYSTALQNMTGHPAMSLPAGQSPNGLPFGLQVTGPRFAEEMLLAVAQRWERAHPWPRSAPGYEPFETVLGPAARG